MPTGDAGMSKLWLRIESDIRHGDVQSTDPTQTDRIESDLRRGDVRSTDPTQTDRSVVVDPCCMILSNLTIDPENCEMVWTGFVQVRCVSRNQCC
jgi:hypothetical protein